MGLEDLVGGVLKGGTGDALLRAATDLVGSGAGLGGLVGLLRDKGLGDVADSWVGTGENKPVSSSQIADALGPDQVAQVAEQAGVSREEASSGLAEVLPKLVNELTPDGSIPGGDEIGAALGKLKGILG
jgi:uncharacterized protein YidB (DUF937 family)